MKTTKTRLLLLTALSTALSLQGGTVFTENFESAAAGFYTAGVIAGTGFSVVSGSVDINGGASYGWLCSAPASGLCLDTTGSTGTTPGRGVIETTSSLNLAGMTSLSFSLVRWNDAQFGGGAQDASITVTLGAFSETFTVDASFTDQTIVRNFLVASPTMAKLRITDNSGTLHAAGAIVDNFSITSEVPEPGTMMLAGLALLTGGFLRRRK